MGSHLFKERMFYKCGIAKGYSETIKNMNSLVLINEKKANYSYFYAYCSPSLLFHYIEFFKAIRE